MTLSAVLVETAARILVGGFSKDDWLEAFAPHPRIGDIDGGENCPTAVWRAASNT